PQQGGNKMIVTTMNDIPGYEVDEVYGEVMGLTVRSRNLGSQIGAGLKSILGGELKGMTKALVDSRNQVRERMVEEAEQHGANASMSVVSSPAASARCSPCSSSRRRTAVPLCDPTGGSTSSTLRP